MQKPKVEAISSQPTPPPPPLPPEVEEVKKIPTSTTNWLAELKEGTHTVDYRLHNESVWKKAEPGITFIRFDALQTQDDSKAKVLYKSGTQLDIKSNTMIIFDNDPGVDKNHEDRVVIKNGELVGTTRNELWVFTDAGLIQLKAEKNKHKAAQARVTLQPHQKLKINVQTGQADVIYTDDKKIEKIQIAANKQIELNRPTVKLDEKKLQELIIAAPKIKTPLKSELIIENPKADTTTDQKTFEVKGRLSAIGAQLLINGQLIQLNEDLSFAKTIELNEGANLVVFQLIRSDASTQFIRKTIKQNKSP